MDNLSELISEKLQHLGLFLLEVGVADVLTLEDRRLNPRVHVQMGTCLTNTGRRKGRTGIPSPNGLSRQGVLLDR